MKPTDEELERMAVWAETHDMRATGDKIAALLRACKGRDELDAAREMAEQIACIPWGALWNHGTLPSVKERAEWRGRREAALDILCVLDPDCAKSIIAALEQEPPK